MCVIYIGMLYVANRVVASRLSLPVRVRSLLRTALHCNVTMDDGCLRRVDLDFVDVKQHS